MICLRNEKKNFSIKMTVNTDTDSNSPHRLSLEPKDAAGYMLATAAFFTAAASHSRIGVNRCNVNGARL